MHELAKIGTIILENLAQVWPLLAISIPLAVLLRVSGLAKRMKGAFSARPVIGILIATAAGAFGPFCSCTVIPVVASMLIGGIPLAPVMAFWIASPTMDPEIFFMSIAILKFVQEVLDSGIDPADPANAIAVVGLGLY